jgi:hypothetical protein
MGLWAPWGFGMDGGETGEAANETKQNGSEDSVENKLDKHSETWTARKTDGTGKESMECGAGIWNMERKVELGAWNVQHGI